MIVPLEWYNDKNEKKLLNAFVHGSCLESEIPQEKMVNHEDVGKKLSKILLPNSDHSSYHVVVRNHRTGKTTVVRQYAKKIGKGLIYSDVSLVLDKLINNLANAIGYEFTKYVSIVES
ncbi:hypothetical protein RclHR1_12410002 [Rhizophagus clarus]|uniref:P-loop containing nucleoside triphosphate hydrolase protein n=1 Tax=Rhizophagus clarus TaxID=94130 RepID=A0A2Z6QBW8_9GLOM|nr:hypothetical protein RclHR1_12410002 [Rhizophagus clarus]GES73750.1 P-loop containing nucleoside triphosphate hydrolase protein [Rhizophagus clarus]